VTTAQLWGASTLQSCIDWMHDCSCCVILRPGSPGNHDDRWPQVRCHAGADCSLDTFEGCDYNGADLSLHPLSSAPDTFKVHDPWSPALHVLSTSTSSTSSPFSWTGPRSCRCMTAWLAALGPHAPELRSGLQLACTLVNSTADLLADLQHRNGAHRRCLHRLRGLLGHHSNK
jgi:hypothetical protein